MSHRPTITCLGHTSSRFTFSSVLSECLLELVVEGVIYYDYRTVANWTRFLDPTRPITFVSDQKPGNDYAVSDFYAENSEDLISLLFYSFKFSIQKYTYIHSRQTTLSCVHSVWIHACTCTCSIHTVKY